MDDAALTFVARLDDQASTPARGLRSTMDGLAGPVDPITAAVVMQADGVERMVGDVEQAGARAEATAAESGDEGGRRFSEGFTESVEDLGAAVVPIVAAVGVAAGAAITASLVSAINVDAANDKLAAQLGLSVDEAERLGGVAGDVYAAAWGEDLGAVNDAVGAVYSSIDGMTSASEEDLESATVKALAFADAFETDVGRSAQVAGQLIRNGLAKDADEAFDLLVASAQQVPANIREDLLDAADEYGPFFASLGLSGEQAFAMLVDASDKGMYGVDKMGDALKELTIRATDMSAASATAYEAAGLNAEDMAARFLAGGDVAAGALSDLVAGLQSIEDPTARANAAIGLFGTPLEDLGVTEIPAFLDAVAGMNGELENVEGTADRMAATLGDNAASNLESFKRQATTLATEVIGGKLLPVVEDVASSLATTFGPAVQQVTRWMGDNKEVVGLVATYLGTLIGGILLLVGALKVWAAVQAILNVALTANPIGIIIVAIGALIAVIVYIATQTTWFQDIWAAAWGWIQDVVAGVVSWWEGTFLPAITSVFNIIKAYVLAYLSFWRAIWDGIVAAVRWAVDFVAALFRTYVAIWRAVIEGAVNGIRAVIGWFGNLPGMFAGWFAGVANAISGAWGSIVGAVSGIVQNIRNVLQGVIDSAYRIGSDIVSGIANGIRSAVGRVVDAAKAIVNNITGPVKKLLGIASPSKVFAYFGRMTVAGLEGALDDGQSDVQRAAENLAASAIAPMNEAAKVSNDLTGQMTVTRATESAQTVTIRHEVVSPDGSVRNYTAQELARIIAADPRAAGIVEGAVRTATASRDSRTLVATN